VTPRTPAGLAASVRQRLLDRAKARGEDYNYTLSQYAVERFLFRLSRSVHRDRFVLKGARLFCLWSENPHRATWDLDLLGRGGSIPEVAAAVSEICATPVEDDGLEFDTTSVQGEAIREGQEYEGVRTRLLARLGAARIPVQVDVGFGDAVTPAPRLEIFPGALAQPRARVLAYCREAVVAEKLEAMVALGARNSRMKDFYDIQYLAREFAFAGPPLADAVLATFRRRATPLSERTPLGLTAEFAAMPERAAQWRAFLRRGRLSGAPSLASQLDLLRAFLLPVLGAVRTERGFAERWPPGGPWRPER
jgi:hypothetical protein